MKITKRQLRRIIREYVDNEEINPFGTDMEPVVDPDEDLDVIGHT